MYSKLRELHAKYGPQVEIVLFPSDEFGQQELPSEQIPDFVKGYQLPTDGGGCTLMQKVNVNGPAADPVFKLAKSAFPGDISWNFAGIFIFDKHGKPVGRFSARELSKVEATLDALLTDKEL